jgi:hypothetical protein
VLDLRNVFEKIFKSFDAGLGNSVKPNFRGFSDSFVVSVPLKRDDDNSDERTLARCMSALSAASIVMLTSLASKHALRGGIDVGAATEITTGEIYGAASERVYLLESRQADYPRVLIGDELWNYLSLGIKEFEKLTTPDAERIRKLIRRLVELTTVDADGRRILDYLGPGTASMSTQNRARILVQPAYQFVLDQQQHWLSKGNTKLSGRYAVIRRYFESRLPLWGLSAIKS